ncbi:MAG: ferritin family protein [Ignisphaera sp.]
MASSDILYKVCRDEYEAYTLYRALTKSRWGKKYRSILEKAAEDELHHYRFWTSVVGKCTTNFTRIKVLLYTIVLYLFGLTVTLKFIESRETDASRIYRELSESRPDLKDSLSKIIGDEERHEAEFASSIDEGRVRYLGSITLGISDALIELTGIYTGSLGAFENTISAGLTGFLAGVAASISMGIASYSQAKHEAHKNPKLSALYTSIAYLIVVILLALPYFVIKSMIFAFMAMVIIAIVVVAYMTFYTTVLHNRNYLREFIETTTMILGVSLLLYILGSILGKLIGIEIK